MISEIWNTYGHHAVGFILSFWYTVTLHVICMRYIMHVFVSYSIRCHFPITQYILSVHLSLLVFEVHWKQRGFRSAQCWSWSGLSPLFSPANGGRTCLGRTYQFELCSREECGGLYQDFREKQCLSWAHTLDEQKAKHHWLPYEHRDRKHRPGARPP